MRKALLAAVTLALVIAGIWWITKAPETGPSGSTGPASSSGRTTAAVSPSQGGGSPAGGSAPAKTDATAGAQPIPVVVKPITIQESVAAVREDLDRIYGFAGELNWDQAKELVGKREEERKIIVDQLAGLGPGGAQAMADRYASADLIREKMIFAEALGRINDPAAVAALAAIFAKENSYSMQKELVHALGARTEDEARVVLTGILADNENEDVRFAAAHGLSGDEKALPDLVSRVQNDPSEKVRRETIGVIGKLGSDAAMDAIASFAQQASFSLAVRQNAIQELPRTFKDKALPFLTSLAADPDPEIRLNVVTAANRLTTPEARALITSLAANDPSAQVKDSATAAMSTWPAATATADITVIK